MSRDFDLVSDRAERRIRLHPTREHADGMQDTTFLRTCSRFNKSYRRAESIEIASYAFRIHRKELMYVL